MDSMDCDLQLKRARDMDDLCDAMSRKVVCVEENDSSEGSCESWSETDVNAHAWSEDGDPHDLDDPDDAPYRPMRRYWEYEDSDSESDDPVDQASPEIDATGEVPYVNIAPCPGADWCVDVTPPDVPEIWPDEKWPDEYWMENPGEAGFDRFPDGVYRSRVLMTPAQVVECIKNAAQHYGALAVMAEDYIRSLLRFEPDRVYASAVSRAFVDFAIRKLLDDPEAYKLLKVEEFEEYRRSRRHMDYAVSYRSWRRLEMTYGFKP
jgi:hypothetical protein